MVGAFVAAPVGGLLFAVAAFICRVGFLWTVARVRGHTFDALDPPPPLPAFPQDRGSSGDPEEWHGQSLPSVKGKFF